jgi:hypothetical protein
VKATGVRRQLLAGVATQQAPNHRKGQRFHDQGLNSVLVGQDMEEQLQQAHLLYGTGTAAEDAIIAEVIDAVHEAEAALATATPAHVPSPPSPATKRSANAVRAVHPARVQPVRYSCIDSCFFVFFY